MAFPRTVLLPLLVVACAAPSTGEPPASEVQQAIVGGTPSDATQDAVVLIVNHDPETNTRLGICTGALIGPRLVLTARHCLSRIDPEPFACKVDGTSEQAGGIGENYLPSNLYVFTGRDRPAFTGFEPPDLDTTKWQPAGRGLEIVDDGSTNLCDHDLGLLVLKDPITSIAPATLRLDGDAAKGERLTTVGWGVTSDQAEPDQRQQRGDVLVQRVGPDAEIPVLTPSEFLFNESICLGDSGGPIFAQATHAVVGVVSRGGNGADPSGGPSVTCIEADNIGTKLSPFRDLVMKGFAKAGGEPRLEPKPEDEGCAVARLGSRRDATSSVSGVALVVGVAALRGRRARRGADATPND